LTVRRPRTAVVSRIVVRLDLQPVNLVLSEPFAIAGGAPEVAHNVFVRAVLADGSAGYGEAAPFEAVSGETQSSTLTALRAAVPLVEGQDAAGWRRIAATVGRHLADAPAARCAVEQAVVDALARHLGLSLVDYFGGGAATLTTDLTLTVGDVARTARAAERAAAAGFGTLKVKVGGGDPEHDVERLRACVTAAPRARLLVDANEGYTPAQARAFLRGVAAAGIALDLVEQPVPRADTPVLTELQREFGVPICADESMRGPADALALIRTDAVRVLNVKLMKFGLADALDIIALARSAGIECMVGGMVESSVSMSFSAALAAANQPPFTHIDLDTPLFIRPEHDVGGIAYAGEVISLPIGEPGSGVDAAAYFGVEG
jgi:L-Ala-D/L-Glu epimerase / N-acetyl-D-glutamate racemase